MEQDVQKYEKAKELLKNVVDPELGISIADLGLIYDFRVEENRAHLLMTLTTMGCPIGGMIADQVRSVLEPLHFDDVQVELTFDPPWTPDRITPEGRRYLGLQ